MSTALLPPETKFARVVGSFMVATGDTTIDADRHPDGRKVGGTLVIAPDLRGAVNIGGVTVWLEPITVNLVDSKVDVFVVASDTSSSVAAPGWTYTATFTPDTPGVPKSSWVFLAPSDPGLVDLATATPVAAASGTRTLIGPAGADGAGIANVSFDTSGVPTFTLTDGTAILGDRSLRGPAGPTGGTDGTIPAENVEGFDAAAAAVADARINALIGGAPAALDTLAELASALGGDANFSTTVANQIAALSAKTVNSATAVVRPAGSPATASLSNGVLTVGVPTGPKGDLGPAGPKGDPGPAGVTGIGTVTTVSTGSAAAATVSNGLLNLSIPRGPQGDTGGPGITAIGTVSTLAPGSPATASLRGTLLDLGLPRGADGAAGGAGGGIVSASATTLAPGSAATATLSGTELIIGVPRGAQGPAGPKGDTGSQGPAGPKGDAGSAAALPLGFTVRIVHNGTNYVLPAGGAVPSRSSGTYMNAVFDFVGPTDPGTLARDGDSWSTT